MRIGREYYLKRRKLLGGIGGTLGVLSGCISWNERDFDDLEPLEEYWNQPRGRSDGSRYLGRSAPSGNVSERWSRSVGEVVAGPVVYGETVVVAERTEVTAHELANGTERWTFDVSGTGTDIVGHVAVTDRSALVVTYASDGPATTDSRISCFDVADGSMLWEDDFDPVTYLRLGDAGGAYLVTRDDDVAVTCIDPRSGDTVWSTPSDGLLPDSWSGGDWTDVTLADFVVGREYCYLVGYDDETLVRRMNKRTGDIDGEIDLPLDRVFECTVRDGNLIAASDSHPEGKVTKSITCWSVDDGGGELLWTSASDRGVGQFVTTPERAIYVPATPDGGAKLTCVRLSTGETLWERPVSEVPSLAAAGDRLYAVDGNEATGYAIESGDRIWESTRASGTDVVPAGEGLLTVESRGSLTRLS